MHATAASSSRPRDGTRRSRSWQWPRGSRTRWPVRRPPPEVWKAEASLPPRLAAPIASTPSGYRRTLRSVRADRSHGGTNAQAGSQTVRVAAEHHRYAVEQLVGDERLRQVVVGARAVARDQVVVAAAVGEHDDRDHREARIRLDLRQNVRAAHAGHDDVEDDHIGAAPVDRRERRDAVRARLDLDATRRQHALDEHAVQLVVVHYEDMQAHAPHIGRSFPNLEAGRRNGLDGLGHAWPPDMIRPWRAASSTGEPMASP